MQLLYGTTNQGKLQHMRDMLYGLNIDIVGLHDLKLPAIDVDERGNNPLENACIKALAYFQAYKTPVFSCDSGLFFDSLPIDEQPGVHIRRVNGQVLDDEQMLAYYTQLALRFGGQIKARYRNAVCLIVNGELIYQHDGLDIASEEFIITSIPHPQRTPGFPLDSLSIEPKTGRYYFDLHDHNKSGAGSPQSAGFRKFFSAYARPMFNR